MSMATRCPHCSTLFRVRPADLQARQGQVRCGRCMQVFDGFSALAMVPDIVAVPEEPAAREAPAQEPSAPASPVVAPQQDMAPAAPLPLPEDTERRLERADDVAPPSVAAPVAEPEAMHTLPPGAAGAESEHPALSSAQVADALHDAREMQPEPHPVPASVFNAPPATGLAVDAGAVPVRRGGRRWAAGSVVLALGLVLQAAYAFRGELVARYPDAAPLFDQLCAVAGCRVLPPQRPKLINIEGSDMQIPDPGQPGMIRLTATLRNHAGHGVAYPAIDLVLTNKNDHTLARRIFLPQEYLDREWNPGAGMAANAEITVKLDLDTGDLGPAGFRLDLLPAP